MVKPAQTAVDEKKLNEEKQKEEESKKGNIALFIFKFLSLRKCKKCYASILKSDIVG